ncbi:hypothetical protein KSF_018590 [Reticulibacter mediterranei]|uniref:Uncharacterized protein n=1 Tax=Reticulibacter mediterranei TaxID=2778369 RepID=A0A8J3ICL0_9CHLR|nr:hypothetical protein [Reticulibacter mediterranei]GHO91811.1 hypothetical protein KSF_018590 [Reticulibacter mediterranei]
MSNEGSFAGQVQPTISNQELVAIMTELSHCVVSAHHVDDIFFWLARIIAQHLDVEVVEFWTKQVSSSGSSSLYLRALVTLGDTVPERLVNNDAVRMIVEDIQHERRGFWLKSVADLFTPYQSNLLGRYGLNYCSSYLLKSTALLPPPKKDVSARKIATPLVLGVLLFLEHPPSQRLLLGIGHILERALMMAKKQGLLYTTGNTEPLEMEDALVPQRHLSLRDLIPRYVQERRETKAGNFQHEPIELPNRQVREVYAAIDGQKSVAELIAATQLSMEEIRASLRILLLRHRVKLYEPGGSKWIVSAT